jgi:DNA-binding Lrp family transcriptional regulator
MGRLGVDRETLHQLLWDRADSVGRLKIKQGDLAEELDLRFETISRIFKEFREEGRIRKLTAYKDNVALYQIVDPKVYRWGGVAPGPQDSLFD